MRKPQPSQTVVQRMCPSESTITPPSKLTEPSPDDRTSAL
jgi:hypothetical protein